MRKERRWKAVALLTSGMLAGMVLVGSPAGAHVSSWAHNWKKHIKPKADARYHTKSRADTRFMRYGTTVTLPSGQAVVGTFGMGDVAAGAGETTEDAISFVVPLAAAPVGHIIPEGGVPPAGCSGTAANPGAQPGHLCIFVAYSSEGTSIDGYYSADSGTGNTVGRHGATLYLFSDNAGTFEATGTYAVRAHAGPAPAPRADPSASLGSDH